MKMIALAFLLLSAPAAHAFSLLGGSDKAAERLVQVPATKPQMQLSFSPIVKRTAPAVVNIYTRKKVVKQQSLFADPFFEQLFGSQFGMGVPRARMESSLGSGVIVTAEGQVVTSYHVVEGAQDIMVVLSDRREFNARMIRSDPQSDLAVLQMETKGESFTALPLRDSDTLEVGDLV